MRVVLAVAAALTLLVSGCGEAPSAGTEAGTDPGATPGATPAATTQAPPDGWRWESFGDAELAVPSSWGYGITQSPWCIATHPARPYVGRPGAVPAVGCAAQLPEGATTDPAFLAVNGTFVWFSEVRETPAGTDPASQGDRLVLRRGHVQIEIQAPAELRNRIAGTVRTITADQNGCPVSHPISGDPTWRPRALGGIAQYPDPMAVSACRYRLATPGDPAPAAALLSSIRLTGRAAVDAWMGLDAPPAGSGPNAPDSCSKEYAYGDEVIILRITYRDGAAPHEVVLRLSGCDHHGFDNGDEIRQLTPATVAPFITGPNQVNSSSMELSGVLHPDGQPDQPVVTKS